MSISPTLISALAVFITSVVGVFAFLANKKASENQLSMSGTNTAISGLEVLAKQHALEIKRINDAHNAYVIECEVIKADCLKQISKHEGQIDVLKNSSDTVTASNREILATLKASAVTLATDTLAAATAAKIVKTDLAKDTEAAAGQARDVKSTLAQGVKDRANAAKEVKTDLEKS